MAPKQRRQRADRCRALIIVVCIAFTAASLLYRGQLTPHGTQHGRSAKPIVALDHELAGEAISMRPRLPLENLVACNAAHASCSAA